MAYFNILYHHVISIPKFEPVVTQTQSANHCTVPFVCSIFYLSTLLFSMSFIYFIFLNFFVFL